MHKHLNKFFCPVQYCYLILFMESCLTTLLSNVNVNWGSDGRLYESRYIIIIYVCIHILTSRCRTVNNAVLVAWTVALEPACQWERYMYVCYHGNNWWLFHIRAVTKICSASSCETKWHNQLPAGCMYWCISWTHTGYNIPSPVVEKLWRHLPVVRRNW